MKYEHSDLVIQAIVQFGLDLPELGEEDKMYLLKAPAYIEELTHLVSSTEFEAFVAAHAAVKATLGMVIHYGLATGKTPQALAQEIHEFLAEYA